MLHALYVFGVHEITRSLRKHLLICIMIALIAARPERFIFYTSADFSLFKLLLLCVLEMTAVASEVVISLFTRSFVHGIKVTSAFGSRQVHMAEAQLCTSHSHDKCCKTGIGIALHPWYSGNSLDERIL